MNAQTPASSVGSARAIQPPPSLTLSALTYALYIRLTSAIIGEANISEGVNQLEKRTKKKSKAMANLSASQKFLT